MIFIKLFIFVVPKYRQPFSGCLFLWRKAWI
nr:MAG TPA: hypothetical protein [Caudoviricetes sp.]